MNQTCKVCGEPAAGFHFGAFTCEGCKSFFGRSYNNLSSISECKNNGKCVIDKKNRTTCKACRLRKCYAVGMSKGGSRYGRRSNWFKIHCLLQEQQQQALDVANRAAAAAVGGNSTSATNSTAGYGDMSAAEAVAKHQMQSLNPHYNSLFGGHPYNVNELMVPSVFMSGAALGYRPDNPSIPFFSMLPPQPGFPMLFPTPVGAAGYRAPAAYFTEMYNQRKSVDSATSGSSDGAPQHAVPVQHTLPAADKTANVAQKMHETHAVESRSPELCVAGGDDDDDEELEEAELNVHSPLPTPTNAQQIQRDLQQHKHQIHSPIPIHGNRFPTSPLTVSVPTSTLTPNSLDSYTPETFSPTSTSNTTTAASTETTALAFAEKLQSLSPVSDCSNTAESTQSSHNSASDHMDAQDGPMDLSMKTIGSTSSGDCEMSCDMNQNENIRKYISYHSDSDMSSDISGNDEIAQKRSKLTDEGYSSVGYASSHGSTASTGSAASSMRGIYLCV